MTTSYLLALFLNFSSAVCATVFSRPRWFFGPRHNFGAGGILIVLLIILLLFFGVRLLMGEGKSQ
jgi:hypothetical protein